MNYVIFLNFFSEYLLPLTESITNENHSSTYLDKYDLSINISDKIGVSKCNTDVFLTFCFYCLV